VHDGSAGDCRCDDAGLATCSAGVEVVRSQRLPGGSHAVGLRSNVRSMAFDPTVGTVTPTASVRLNAPVGELRLVVNVMGRVRSCTPDRALPGLPAC
jgi:type IV fimbrial biogenesis protein FimT